MEKKQRIKISIVIPVYNAETYVGQCIGSALSQGIPEIEVICVDDGSTDSSLKVLEACAAQDSRIRVVHQKNQFAGAARNRGMELASGKYIAFMDADDFYLPGALQALYDTAEQQRADIAKGGFEIWSTASNLRTTTLYSTNSCISGKWYRQPCNIRNNPRRLMNTADVPCNAIYKLDFLRENQIRFNAQRCVNDHSFFVHCILKAERVAFTRALITCYRVDQNASLVGRKAQYYQDQLGSYRLVRELCEDAAPEIRQMILQMELNAVFSWTEKLQQGSPSDLQLREQLRSFLRDFCEEDVGQTYLREFPFRNLYYQLRYGENAPGKRPSVTIRMIRCWNEHGWRYTAKRLKRRIR